MATRCWYCRSVTTDICGECDRAGQKVPVCFSNACRIEHGQHGHFMRSFTLADGTVFKPQPAPDKWVLKFLLWTSLAAVVGCGLLFLGLRLAGW